MDTKLLDNTSLAFLYKYASSDQQLTFALSIGIFLAAVASIIWNLFEAFPYGKASKPLKERRFFEYPLSSKFVWRWGFCPTVIVPWILIYLTPTPYITHLTNIVPLALYYIHYFYRSMIYPSRISDKAQPSSILLFVVVLFGTIVNTFNQTHYLLNVHPPGNPLNISLILGTTISILGAIINHTHDNMLTALRGDGAGYKIPRGGLFEYVSCANYLGELIEWWGCALITGAHPQIGFALFSSSFLVFRAWYSHRWYHSHFGVKYPPNRKAIVPFLF